MVSKQSTVFVYKGERPTTGFLIRFKKNTFLISTAYARAANAMRRRGLCSSLVHDVLACKVAACNAVLVWTTSLSCTWEHANFDLGKI